MTESPRGGRPPVPHAGALSRLLGDTSGEYHSVAEFAAHTWGRRPHRSRIDDVSDLFSGADVDDLITVRGLRAPFLRVAKDGRTFGDREFTSGGGVGAAIGDQLNDDLVWRHFEAGATLVLQGLHRTHEPILHFTQDLAAGLGHPCQVNAYVTPPQNTGFSDHYDVHDVFVVQVEGTKRWRIREPVWEVPLRDQTWDLRQDAVAAAAQEEPLDEFVMEPGDVLYLPRGYLHAATALGEVSIHLTIGVHEWTRHHLAEQLTASALQALAQDPSVRAALPVGVDVADPADLTGDIAAVREALLAALADVPDSAIASALAGRARSAQRTGPLRPLAQLAAVRGGSGLIELRPHLRARLLHDPLRLASRAGTLALEPADEADIRKLLEVPGGPVPVSSGLGERLLRAGVCIPSSV